MKRRSIVWATTRVKFAAIVARSTTYRAITRELHAYPHGRTNSMIRERIAAEGLDASHLLGCAHWRRHAEHLRKEPVALELVLVEHSTYCRSSLKKRLLKVGLLKNECALCGQGPTWKGNPLSLRLDHKNGIFDDSRLGNLRMVCPNCDSQLPTFCARNHAKWRCAVCRKKIAKKSTRCSACENLARIGRGTKIEWPPLPELFAAVQGASFLAAGKKLGVSDNAIRKRLSRWAVGKLATPSGFDPDGLTATVGSNPTGPAKVL